MHHPQSSLRKLLTHVTQHMQLSCTTPPDTAPPECDGAPSGFALLPVIAETTSITPQLEALGLPPVVAQQASDTYLKAARDLHDVCQTSLRNALRAASAKGHVNREEAQTINQVWNAAYVQQTRAWAEDTFTRARNAVAKAGSAAQRAKEKKPIFNHEYTPLLEKYFEYNAYPSAPDRAVLARKSMMTPRQIEVWFQNHRNRARKDGKPLRRLAEDPLPLEISLKSLERKMPFFTIPEHERKPVDKSEPLCDDSSDDENMSSTQMSSCAPAAADALDPPRPQHAFPSVYPPHCDYHPFPTEEGTHKFPPLVWFRKPAAASRIAKIPINMDEFIADFETKLHLRAPVIAKRRSKPAHSWCVTRTIVPPPAPHPAFVRSPKPVHSGYTSHLQAVPASSSQLHPFRSPSPFSQPTTLIPPQQSNDIPVRRKVARLPRRTPKNASTGHHRASPAISESSPAPSRSSSSASRSSSFGSDVLPERRPSSSSGSSSSSSSALSTPVLEHSELPEEGHTPISVSDLNLESTDGLISATDTVSPVEGSPFNFSMTPPPKQTTAFGFDFTSAGPLWIRHPPVRSHALLSSTTHLNPPPAPMARPL